MNIVHVLGDILQGSSYLLGQRFIACVVLKFAHQRGEKGGNAIFKTKHIEPFTQEIPRLLYKVGRFISHNNMFYFLSKLGTLVGQVQYQPTTWQNMQ